MDTHVRRMDSDRQAHLVMKYQLCGNEGKDALEKLRNC